MSVTIRSPIRRNSASSSRMKRRSAGGRGSSARSTSSATRGNLARPSAEADVAGGAAAVRPVGALGDAIGGVALDRVDAAVGVDRLDDADVLAAPHEEVAGRGPRAGGHRAVRLLGPRPDRGHGAEALAVVA